METSKYYRALFGVCSIIAGVCVHAFKCTADDNNWISKIDKSIVKEPKYRAKPRYALLVIGAESKIPIPDKATTGIATVTILVPLTEFPLELSIDHFEVPVVSKK